MLLQMLKRFGKGGQKGSLSFKGKVTPKVWPKYSKVSLGWKLKNVLRYQYIINWIRFYVAKVFTRWVKVPTMTGRLKAVLIRPFGAQIDYGVVGHGLVTTAFVNHLVDELQAASEFADYDQHDSGEGTTGAAVGDTDIETTDGESRSAGTPGEGATAEIYENVGTISYTTTKAITEHGLFCNTTGATLMDRHTFSAINVGNGDSIQFTYELTVNDGG